ncbi:hypothetical protein AJ80_04188, partial [Polytolypa hystricis UAMH7299]
MRSLKLTLAAALLKLSSATYILEDNYQPSNFFDKFDFFSDADPSNAFVKYVDRSTAKHLGLIETRQDAVYMGVDHKSVVSSGAGRKSVRIETKKTYKHGLIIADIEHMPGGICGTWPAFWTTGATWPDDGEFDIIEGVNSQQGNKMAVHTTAGCKIKNNGKFSGQISTPNCDVHAPEQATNQGCLIDAPNNDGYGPTFNKNQGGVYATEWTSDAITVWFFPRGQIPQGIKGPNPNPKDWGTPIAQFTGDCDWDKYMQEQTIIFNTAFCGDWANALWDSDSTCKAKAPTCNEYVKNNPAAFKNAYWEINYMKVFKKGTLPTTKTTATSTSTTATTESTAVTESTTAIESTTATEYPTGTDSTTASTSVTNTPSDTATESSPTADPT